MWSYFSLTLICSMIFQLTILLTLRWQSRNPHTWGNVRLHKLLESRWCVGTRVMSLSRRFYVSQLSDCQDGVELENGLVEPKQPSVPLFLLLTPCWCWGCWDAFPLPENTGLWFRGDLTSPRSTLHHRLQTWTVAYLPGHHWTIHPSFPVRLPVSHVPGCAEVAWSVQRVQRDPSMSPVLIGAVSAPDAEAVVPMTQGL